MIFITNQWQWKRPGDEAGSALLYHSTAPATTIVSFSLTLLSSARHPGYVPHGRVDQRRTGEEADSCKDTLTGGGILGASNL